MIEIRLVKMTRNGIDMLIGERFSDRFNLESLGIKNGIRYERNQGTLKIARRRLAGLFTLTVVRNGQRLDINPVEMGMMSRTFRVAATAMAMLKLVG